MKPTHSLLFALLFASFTVTGSAQPLFAAGARVLFQGDSITDMGRGRTADPNHILGHSYVFIIAAQEGATYPEREVVFLNRGISGNTVPDLAARWRRDTLDLKPDVLSILIGANDIGHPLRTNQPVNVESYEKAYDQLLAETVAALPKVRLVLCEPFFAPGKATAAHAEEWAAAMKSFRAVVEKLGAKYHAPVVHFQKVIGDACQRAPVEHWIWDGVHPTYSGQQLLADEWRRTYRAFYGSEAKNR